MKPHFSNAYNTNNSNYVKNTTKRLLFIDSRDCNKNEQISSFNNSSDDVPNPFNFNVKLESSSSNVKSIGIEPYRNIEKITLKHFGIPKIKDEHYVILDIPDFFDYLDSTDNKGSHRATTILYYDNSNDSVGTIKQNHEIFDFEFSPRLNAINNLNIKITKHGGEPITTADFDDDMSLDDINKIHTTFLFEITYVP